MVPQISVPLLLLSLGRAFALTTASQESLGPLSTNGCSIDQVQSLVTISGQPVAICVGPTSTNNVEATADPAYATNPCPSGLTVTSTTQDGRAGIACVHVHTQVASVITTVVAGETVTILHSSGTANSSTAVLSAVGVTTPDVKTTDAVPSPASVSTPSTDSSSVPLEHETPLTQPLRSSTLIVESASGTRMATSAPLQSPSSITHTRSSIQPPESGSTTAQPIFNVTTAPFIPEPFRRSSSDLVSTVHNISTITYIPKPLRPSSSNESNPRPSMVESSSASQSVTISHGSESCTKDVTSSFSTKIWNAPTGLGPEIPPSYTGPSKVLHHPHCWNRTITETKTLLVNTEMPEQLTSQAAETTTIKVTVVQQLTVIETITSKTTVIDVETTTDIAASSSAHRHRPTTCTIINQPLQSIADGQPQAYTSKLSCATPADVTVAIAPPPISSVRGTRTTHQQADVANGTGNMTIELPHVALPSTVTGVDRSSFATETRRVSNDWVVGHIWSMRKRSNGEAS